MYNYDMIIALVDRARAEIKQHDAFRKEHSYWYSGHKNKAKRAISTARELLLEASKELDKEAT